MVQAQVEIGPQGGQFGRRREPGGRHHDRSAGHEAVRGQLVHCRDRSERHAYIVDVRDDFGPDTVHNAAHPTVTPASRSCSTAASPSPGFRLTAAVAARSTVVSNPSRAESRAVSFTQ